MGRISYSDLNSGPEPGKARVWLPILVESIVTAIIAAPFFSWPLPAIAGWSSALVSNLVSFLFLVVVGGGILSATISFLSNAQQERLKFAGGADYIPVSATVKEVWLEEFSGSSGGMVYQPRMSIEYEVSGQSFTAQMNLSETRHNVMSLHKRTLKKHAPGTKVQVYIDSKHPEDCHRGRPTNLQANIKLFMALLVNLFPCAMLGLGLLFGVSAIVRLIG